MFTESVLNTSTQGLHCQGHRDRLDANGNSSGKLLQKVFVRKCIETSRAIACPVCAERDRGLVLMTFALMPMEQGQILPPARGKGDTCPWSSCTKRCSKKRPQKPDEQR